jgi:NAD(P)-dependent dehydrogenase (short-subunit alcohol dehydrogenase family)
MSSSTGFGRPDRSRGTSATTIWPGRFAGKVAVVTGAGSGIGRATASRLAAEGGAVACLDVEGDAVEATADDINAATAPAAATTSPGAAGIGGAPAGRAVAIRCDVTDPQSVADAVGAVIDQLGPPNVVCNVAGVGGFVKTEESTIEQWDRTIAVNLTGTFLMCRAVLPILLKRGGCITNVCSTAGLIGQPYSAAYCASKGGVALLTKALAVEYMGRGVRVNAVAPGGVDTPILWDFMPPEDADQKLIDRIMTPMGFTSPAEMASALAFLSSDEAAYATGTILSVDGGITA